MDFRVLSLEVDDVEAMESPERWCERSEGAPDWRREGAGEGEAGAGREDESEVCFDAVPQEPEDVRVLAKI